MVSQMDRACFLIFGGGHLRRHYMRVIETGGYDVVSTHGLLLNQRILVEKRGRGANMEMLEVMQVILSPADRPG